MRRFITALAACVMLAAPGVRAQSPAEVTATMEAFGSRPISDWTEIGFQWRLAIARRIAADNGMQDYDQINVFMRGLARHPVWRSYPMSQGFEAAVVRGKRDGW
jgi:hypothetical protein